MVIASEKKMVAGDENLFEYMKDDERRIRETEYNKQFIQEKLSRLENLLLKEQFNKEKNREVTSKGKKGATRTNPISAGVRHEEALRKHVRDVEYRAEDYVRQVADFEEKMLRRDDFSKDCCEHAGKKMSISELYRNLRMIEESHKYLHHETEKGFQNKVEMKCQAKNYSCFCHCPRKKSKKEWMCGHTYNNYGKCNVFTSCNCNEHECSSGFNSDRSKLNISPETINTQVPHKKIMCSCHEMSSSSDESDASFYKCLHVAKDQFNETSGCSGKDDDSGSETSSKGQTTCSEVSKCTCYCSKDHSHDESSGAESDCDVYHEKKTKTERFRGGLDVVYPKTQTLVKYDNKKLKETKNSQKAANAAVDNLKFPKVGELREGLERLKIRNRNLRDFLDTLQNPMKLVGRPSEANTICTQVSSCYTFDVARQTRSGLLTVVEVLKGKCRNKDAVIVALADELKTGVDTKVDVQDVETDKILMQDKSLVWNGLLEEKDTSRKFTKKDSAIGFAIFLMILISHVKRSEMISYLSAARKVLTESPFKFRLFINEAESFSLDFISTYYQNFAFSFQSFMKHSFDRWVNIVTKSSEWFSAYHEYFDVVNNLLVAYQSYVLFGMCAIFFAIVLKNVSKIWENIRLLANGIAQCGKIYTLFTSTIVRLTKITTTFCLRVLSSRIFWFTLGFCSNFLWNFAHTDFYVLLNSFKMHYITNTEFSLFQNLNETEETIVNDCKLSDSFDYSWLASIFCDKFQSFVQFAYYIVKNI